MKLLMKLVCKSEKETEININPCMVWFGKAREGLSKWKGLEKEEESRKAKDDFKRNGRMVSSSSSSRGSSK